MRLVTSPADYEYAMGHGFRLEGERAQTLRQNSPSNKICHHKFLVDPVGAVRLAKPRASYRALNQTMILGLSGLIYLYLLLLNIISTPNIFNNIKCLYESLKYHIGKGEEELSKIP